MDSIPFPTLSLEESASLTQPFSLDEVDRVLADCDDNRSPGPYGFNFAFIKAFWDMLRPEIGTFFE